MAVDGLLPMRLFETAQISVPFGPGERTLLDLIDGWCGHVMKMFADASGSTDEPWTIHDLVASLYLRDAIHRGLAQLPQQQSEVTIAAVATADEVFRSMTTEDQQGLLAQFDPDVAISPWWWVRIPLRGPIAAEFRLLRRRLNL